MRSKSTLLVYSNGVAIEHPAKRVWVMLRSKTSVRLLQSWQIVFNQIISRHCFSGEPLSLPSLRLLVPPVQLMMASMWRVLKRRDVFNYWKVAEYVSLVVDTVPELLLYKHRTHLNLGLRARVCLHSLINTDRQYTCYTHEHIFICPSMHINISTFLSCAEVNESLTWSCLTWKR